MPAERAAISQATLPPALPGPANLFVPGGPIPGDALFTPYPWLAAGLIAFNVFYLRVHARGLVSGKLSDLGINFLLPILLHAVFEWGSLLVAWRRRRSFRSLGTRGIAAACSVSALYFALLKCVPSFTHVHVVLLRYLAIPFAVDARFRNVADPSDLVTLISTFLAWWYLTRDSQHGPSEIGANRRGRMTARNKTVR